MKQVELNVSGMDCTSCEQRVQTSLGRLEGVVRSRADHRSGRVEVVIKPDLVTEDALRSVISKAGFEVSP